MTEHSLIPVAILAGSLIAGLVLQKWISSHLLAAAEKTRWKWDDIIVKALFDNTNSADKPELKAAITEMLKPPSEEEKQMAQMQKQMQMQLAQLQVEKEKAEVELLKAQTMLALEKAKHEAIEADLEDDMVEIQAANAASAAQKARMADNQNIVAAQRNAIELERIRKLPNKSN